jgi:murein DD-endopeptidase MepM/ murein hydrolase activator NlpD
LLNASVGVQRVRERLRPTSMSRAADAASLERRTLDAAQRLTTRIGSIAHTAGMLRTQLTGQLGRTPPPQAWDPRVRRVSTARRTLGVTARRTLGVRSRNATMRHRGHPLASVSRRTGATVARLRAAGRAEGILPVAVAAIVLFASAFSGGSGQPAGGSTGGPSGNGFEPRIAVGGGVPDDLSGFSGPVEGGTPAEVVTGGTLEGDPSAEELRRVLDGLGPEARALQEEPLSAEGAAPIIDGPFLEDGTLLKPVAVDTSVADGKGLVRRYRVRSGDTLVGIASRFDINMMTIWWANRLSSKNDLDVGQVLRIPTVNGLVVTVREGDTLSTIARTNHVKADAIYEVNGLTDRNLVIGQTLLIPGALGKEIRTPRPAPGTPSPTRPRSTSPVRPPSSYNGGAFAWPVSGGYISQYFHYGHYAIDIAADYGSRVRAGASGTVVFAGYRSNGGGYQVWIAHGSGLYTTYNHMDSVSVGRGQGVGRGQQVGRVGCSGNCSGPHLHFEVWRGNPWDGGSYRVNPLIYY